MTSQQVLDQVDSAICICGLSIDIRDKILDAVWNVLCDHREDEEENE